MLVRDLSNLARELRKGVALEFGPLAFHFRIRVPELAKAFGFLYANHPIANVSVPDFRVSVVQRFGKKFDLFVDGKREWKRREVSQVAAIFEWTINRCIFRHCHQYLLIHAASLEKQGRGLMLVGAPGAGKSTLAVSLIAEGWKLLSDEFAATDVESFRLHPLNRPPILKNESIKLVTKMYPGEVGVTSHNTVKGDVAHLRYPGKLMPGELEVDPAWIVFPKYEFDSAPVIEEVSPACGAISLAKNCFNYSLLDRLGFDVVCRLAQNCTFHKINYKDTKTAFQLIEKLTSRSLVPQRMKCH